MPWPDGGSYWRDLPHFRRTGATYFVTWCLHRSQPRLSISERGIVFRILMHDQARRGHLAAAVVMDNHVHVLVQTSSARSIDRLQHSWKSYSANRLQRESGRRGRIWQTEAWDRIVRTDAELRREARYILHNPPKRWPGITAYPWVWIASGLEQ
jgi:REP element-mobilizing transposase RayT